MRSARLLAVAVLAIVLAFSSAQNVSATATELYYDAGEPAYNYSNTGNTPAQFAVRFSLPSGWSAADVVGFRFYIGTGGSVTVRIYGSLGTACSGTELGSGFPMTFNSGWNEQTGLTGITVDGDFCVVGETINQFVPSFGYTEGNVGDPIWSWFRYSPASPTWDPFSPSGTHPNLMIRAYVVPVAVTETSTVSSTISTTIIESTSSTYSTVSGLSTIGTSTSTSFATSTVTVSGVTYSLTEYVTETDTVYAYLLVILQHVQGAVGGFVESVNKLSVLAPWLAVIGLVGCIATAVVVAKKRRA